MEFIRHCRGLFIFAALQARTFRKQIEQHPMMFALNFVAVRFSLKFSVSHFFDPYKKPMEERGAGGGTVRLWSAVPSPGHKKTKNFKLNQRIAKILSFTCSPYNAPVLAGEKPSQTPKFSPPPPPLPWLGRLGNPQDRIKKGARGLPKKIT